MNESIWDRIESSRERWNVLRHPFYQRWSAGELTARGAGALLGPVPPRRRGDRDLERRRCRRAARAPASCARHAAEERGHVRLWDGFVDESGGDAATPPTAETAECVRAWTAPGDVTETLIRLYAIESGQPEISATKREGLLGRYGFSEGAGTAYFRIHESRDVEHAAEVRELIAEIGADADEDALAAAAESAFRANWRLLDGV